MCAFKFPRTNAPPFCFPPPPLCQVGPALARRQRRGLRRRRGEADDLLLARRLVGFADGQVTLSPFAPHSSAPDSAQTRGQSERSSSVWRLDISVERSRRWAITECSALMPRLCLTLIYRQGVFELRHQRRPLPRRHWGAVLQVPAQLRADSVPVPNARQCVGGCCRWRRHIHFRKAKSFGSFDTHMTASQTFNEGYIKTGQTEGKWYIFLLERGMTDYISKGI